MLESNPPCAWSNKNQNIYEQFHYPSKSSTYSSQEGIVTKVEKWKETEAKGSKAKQRADQRCGYEKTCEERMEFVEMIFSHSYDLYLDFWQLHMHKKFLFSPPPNFGSSTDKEWQAEEGDKLTRQHHAVCVCVCVCVCVWMCVLVWKSCHVRQVVLLILQENDQGGGVWKWVSATNSSIMALVVVHTLSLPGAPWPRKKEVLEIL